MRPLLKVSKIFSFIASPILILIGIINYISVISSFDLSNSAQISGGMIYLLLSVGSAIAIFVSGFFIKPDSSIGSKINIYGTIFSLLSTLLHIILAATLYSSSNFFCVICIFGLPNFLPFAFAISIPFLLSLLYICSLLLCNKW